MNRLSLKIYSVDRTPICELYDNTQFRVRNIVEKLAINEIQTLTFDLPVVPNGKWLNIKNENLVLFNNEYFKIKKPTFFHDEDGKLYVQVECKHYSDNLANDLISIEETTPRNVVDLMKLALCYDDLGQPTKGWTVGTVTVDRVAMRGLEVMEQSPFSILLTIAEKYNGILKFNSQSMTVDMLEAQTTEHPTIDLRVSKNLKNFEISYDTTEMYTRLYCYGGADEDGNELDIMSVNPTGKAYIDNFDYFKKLGYKDDFILAHPELFVSTNIWRDDNYYDAQDLYNDGVHELAKIAQPVVDVKITALDTKAMGLSNEVTQLDLGACIRVYDEELGVDTLCNVISREINYEEPHILNAEVTNSVVYHDTLSKLFTDVNTVSSVVTSGGNLVGGQGTTMEDVKGYLNLYYLNVEQIDAKYATISDLRANYITADEIKAKYIDAESIAAQYATIGQLAAIEAKINNLDVDYINGKLAEFEQLAADMAEFKHLVATDAEFEEIEAGSVTIYGTLKAANAEIDDLKATTVTVGDFNAYKATVEQLFALYASIEYLETNYLKAKQIEATYAKITSLDAVEATIENLKVTVANVETLVAGKASIEDLNAVKATVEQLVADVAEINTVIANIVTTEYLEAELAKINTLITNEISAVNAKITALDAKFATIEQLNAEVANINTLIAKKADIEDLNAAVADIGELEAGLANINTIISGSIGAGTIQTIHLTAQNVVIDDAVIKSANIQSLDVSKLNAGLISTNKFQVQSDDGGFKVVGNTTQWTDATGKVRMQAGRDAEGNFNFSVFGADGTTAIFDENGIHEAAVPDGIIRDDMVADDANIQASKIQYVSSEGNKTLQTIIDIQQGSINALISNTTIDGTSLKDKFTQLQTTVDGLNVTVGDVQSDVGTINSQIASLNLTVDGLTTEVSQAGTDAAEAKTIANQAADKFSWLVKSGTDETNFELTDRTATLVSNYINLHGLVTFTGLNSDVQDKINSIASKSDAENLIPTYLFPVGANISPWVTGTALSHTLGQADPYGGNNALYLKPIATNPQMQINKGGVLKQTGLHTFSLWLKSSKEGTINVYVNTSTDNPDDRYQTFEVGTTWKLYSLTVDVTDLNFDFDILIGGFSSWTDMEFDLYIYKPKLVYGTGSPIVDLWIQDAVMGGITTINGGYIKTQTIQTDQLDVDEILAVDGTFLGIINAQEINADRITSGTVTANRISVYGLTVLQQTTNLETFSIDNDGDVTMRGSVESYNYLQGESGWSIKSNGDAEFNDVTVRGDLIGNYGGMMSLRNYEEYVASDFNYLKNSNTPVTNSNYNIANYYLITQEEAGEGYDVVVVNGDEYMITLNGELGEGKTEWLICNEGDEVILATLTSDDIVSDGVWQKKFAWDDGNALAGNTFIAIYVDPSSVSGVNSTINSVTLVAVNIPNPNKEVVFWAGSNYDRRNYAPFKVYNDGSVEATEGTYSGMWTGDIKVGNITISDPSSTTGSDALVTIRNGQNGIYAVRLTDSDTSTFAQDIHITDDFYNTNIILSQNGIIQTNNRINVGSDDDSTSILPDSIVFGESSIRGNSGGIQMISPSVNIGEVNTKTNLAVYGNTVVNDTLSLRDKVEYGNIIVCNVSTNGIDFNVITEKMYIVQFNSNGGSSVETQKIAEGGKVLKPSDPVRKKYNFAGWYKEPELVNEFNFDTETITASIILYAKWLAMPQIPTILSVSEPSYGTNSTGFYNHFTSGITINASVPDGGTLSYDWISAYMMYETEMSSNNVSIIPPSGYRGGNTLTADMLNNALPEFEGVHGFKYIDDVSIFINCIVKNTLNGHSMSTSVTKTFTWDSQ